MSPFACISETEWELAATMDDVRRRRVAMGIEFEEIIDRIAREGELIASCRERYRGNHTYSRATLCLKVRPETVDLFHSSRSGYRAQFYHSVEVGERANAYAVDRLTKCFVEGLAAEHQGWAERSLTHGEAKVWIHQGRWLTLCRKTERKLNVDRWLCHLSSACRKARKLARWSMLTPQETRIDIKGAFLDARGEWLGKRIKPCRSRQIRERGYT